MSTISRQIEINGEKIAYWTLGHEAAERQIVWAHGWGQDHRAFEQIAGSWAANAYNILIDFPGFGGSPRPNAEWGTADYADACAGLLESLPNGHRIWVGHSFGCRVGIQLAARHAEVIDALFLVAAAGLPRQRSGLSQFRVKSKIALYKSLRALPFGNKDRLLERFGSADYKAAGHMRTILTKVVNEDLSTQAQEISLPAKLVYGSQDDETPPEIGKRLAQLIPNGLFVQLDGLDHYSILNEGRHQTAFQLKQFIDGLGETA
jgi:pimeloyl-ACP methyl ester carboxylesterase|tara:strand:- start:102 stop:887 length:786 start_codon:yes stop_codon:yes gene_type:complete